MLQTHKVLKTYHVAGYANYATQATQLKWLGDTTPTMIMKNDREETAV